MSSNAEFQEHVLNLLTALKAKKEALRLEYERKLVDVDSEITAVTTTARLLRNPPQQIEVEVSGQVGMMRDRLDVASLNGMSARQALIAIAQANGGVVRIKDAKDLLVSAGILRPTKNIWGAIYTTLVRSKEFEKHHSERGAFVLSGEQGTLSAA